MERTKEQVEIEIKEVKGIAYLLCVSAFAVLILTIDARTFEAFAIAVISVLFGGVFLTYLNNQRFNRLQKELKTFE